MAINAVVPLKASLEFDRLKMDLALAPAKNKRIEFDLQSIIGLISGTLVAHAGSLGHDQAL